MDNFLIFTMMMVMTMALSFLLGFDLRTYIEEEKERREIEKLHSEKERAIKKNLDMTMDTFCNFTIE